MIINKCFYHDVIYVQNILLANCAFSVPVEADTVRSPPMELAPSVFATFVPTAAVRVKAFPLTLLLAKVTPITIWVTGQGIIT